LRHLDVSDRQAHFPEQPLHLRPGQRELLHRRGQQARACLVFLPAFHVFLLHLVVDLTLEEARGEGFKDGPVVESGPHQLQKRGSGCVESTGGIVEF